MQTNRLFTPPAGNCLLLAAIAVSCCWTASVRAQLEERHAEMALVEIIKLQHAAAEDVAQSVSIVLPQVQVVADERLNALIVNAPKAALAEVQELVAALDKDTALQRQIKIFELVHIEPDPSLLKTLSTVLDPRTMITFDQKRSTVLAAGPESSLAVIEAVLLRLDEKPAQQDSGKQRALQVRIVWLVADVTDDSASPPPKDLENVLKELERIGITNLKMAAQIVVSTIEGEEFRAGGSTDVAQPECSLQVSGVIGDPRRSHPKATSNAADPVLNLEISASVFDGDEFIRLCEMQTSIRAPLGQSVVLGTTPINSKQSAFVVQIMAGKEEK